MTLTIKQKALLATLGVFAIAVLASFAIDFIARNVSIETIGNVIVAGVVLLFANMIYQIFVSKFEYDERLEKTVNSVDK